MVCRFVLSSAALCIPRPSQRSNIKGSIQDYGKETLLGNHDSWGSADNIIWSSVNRVSWHVLLVENEDNLGISIGSISLLVWRLARKI